MRIVVMGTGGTGGYYGGLLSQQGNDVTFVARGEHLAAIQKAGLHITSINGDFAVSPAQATDNPASLPAPDLILFCTKTYSTDEAAQRIKTIVKDGTTVLSLQNGIDAAERIGAVVGMEHMVGGTTWISSAVTASGQIKQVSDFRRVVMGELDGSRTPRIEAIHRVFKDTGIQAELSENILKVLWTKFVFISCASAFGSLTRLPMGDYRSVPETRQQMLRLMQEVEAVARSQGVNLDADVVQQSLDFIDKSRPQIKASMQLDVESGHRSEVESIIGAIGRKGREADVKTPLADTLYALLLPPDLQARGK